MFPDHYFFAERRLVNHTIETRKVKNFDDCELWCYLNDNCVSLNFKNDPENTDLVHLCELNNATHLKYENKLTNNVNFYYRGSKVSYESIKKIVALKVLKGKSLSKLLKWRICEIFSYSQYSFGKFPLVTESGVNSS